MTPDIPSDQNTEVTTRSDSRIAESRSDGVRGIVKPVDTRARGRHAGLRRALIWLAMIALLFAAWPVSKGLLLKSGTGLGYYMGIIGAVMMLLMLLYPIRKHMRWAQNWGPLRYWFMLHMMFGICGPILVLFHSAFHVKSMNAGVSLFSMLLVASSGIIGRFIYTRIHHGLYGVKSDMRELQQAVEANQEKVNSVLMEAPGIRESLKQFRHLAIAQEGTTFTRAWRFMTLGWQRRKLLAHCKVEFRRVVVYLAKTQGWDSNQQDHHWQVACAQVSDYLNAVQQAAQYAVYERLFRLWHILHTPFVWLLGISAIVHVVAVNMY